MQDVQAAWLLLLFCASARANYWLRTVQPEFTEDFGRMHDENVFRCLSRMLQIESLPEDVRAATSLPLTLGGLGVGSAMRIRDAAHWGSWADCLEMVQARHPQVADDIIRGIVSRARGCLSSVACTVLQEVGVEVPSWEALAAGERPEDTSGEEREPSEPKHGWQKFASTTVQEHHREVVVWPGLARSEQALLRSQSGPLVSVPFTSMPVNRVSRVDSQPFRVLLLRRLRLPLPISVRSCRCGRPFDVFGHHRAACATAGVLGRRGFAVESAVAQICREGGARVSTNVMVRDLDISQSNSTDSRRLEVIAEGFSLFGGGQLALDATLVSVLHRDGTAKRRADTTNGVALREARVRKERTYPELSGSNGRARLVVIAGEVGGRWSQETKAFLWSLASDKASSAPKVLRGVRGRRGTGGGAACLRAQQRRLSRRLCWSRGVHQAQVADFLLCRRSCVTPGGRQRRVLAMRVFP